MMLCGNSTTILTIRFFSTPPYPIKNQKYKFSYKYCVPYYKYDQSQWMCCTGARAGKESCGAGASCFVLSFNLTPLFYSMKKHQTSKSITSKRAGSKKLCNCWKKKYGGGVYLYKYWMHNQEDVCLLKYVLECFCKGFPQPNPRILWNLVK